MITLSKYLMYAASPAIFSPDLGSKKTSEKQIDENSSRKEVIRLFKSLGPIHQKIIMESPEKRLEAEPAKDYLLRKKIKRIIGSSKVKWGE